MVGVPQFAGDEQIGALDVTGGGAGGQRSADGRLVRVHLGGVEVTVAGSDGQRDGGVQFGAVGLREAIGRLN